MERTRVESSAIASVGYQPGRGLLEVEFTSGAIYHYYDIPRTVYQQLLHADSKGRYLNTRIKPAYRYSKVLH